MESKKRTYKKHKRLQAGAGKCYMSIWRDPKNASWQKQDDYDFYVGETPLVNFDKSEEYLADYLKMPDCPFEYVDAPRQSAVFAPEPARIVCTIGEEPAKVLTKRCGECELYSNRTCAFSEDFQKRNVLQVTARQEKYHMNGAVDRSLKDMTINDVRFRCHPAVLKVSRVGYLDKNGAKYDREQLDLIPGVRAMYRGQYSIRLIKAILTHCADGIAREFIAEGYGISDSSVKNYEIRMSDAVRDKKFKILKEDLANRRLLIQRDASGTPYLHARVAVIFGEEYCVLYKFTPNIPKDDRADKTWRETTEVVAIFPISEAEVLKEKLGNLYRQKSSDLEMLQEVGDFSDSDIMKVLAIRSIENRSRTPGEVTFFACKTTALLAKRRELHPQKRPYQKMWDTAVAFGDPLNIADETVWTSLPRLQQYCKTLEEYSQGIEDAELSENIAKLHGLIDYYREKDQDQLYSDFSGESSVCWQAQEEIENYQLHCEKFELKISRAFQNYRKKVRGRIKTTTPDAIRRLLYMNRAVIPTRWNDDGTSTLPFTAEGDLDSRYISTIGIKVHCAERLLNTGLFDPRRTTPLVCVAEKKHSKHPCRGCDFCPQVFPMDELT